MRKQMLKFNRLAMRAIMLMLAFSPLMACTSLSNQTPTTDMIIKVDCVNWKTISYSAPPDSDATVRQIIDNNAAHKEACGD